MKRRNRKGAEAGGDDDGQNWYSSDDAIIRELDGYVEIGMRREGCRIARKILAQERISPFAFDRLIVAITVLSEPKQWMAKLEAAWLRQPASVQREANSTMLALYVSVEDWEKAARHSMPRMLCCPSDFLFAMWALLETGRMKEAARVAQKARKAMPFAEGAFDASILIETLAIYHARAGLWDDAFELWSKVPREQPLSGNAALGGVELCLILALDLIRNELATLHRLPPDFECELSLPGSIDGLRNTTELELKKLQRGLEKMIPEERRLELGFGAA